STSPPADRGRRGHGHRGAGAAPRGPEPPRPGRLRRLLRPRLRQPTALPPDGAFVGSKQVRRNWAEVFAGLPDFRAELLRSARQGDTGWAEWHWHGTRADGTPPDMRGVTTFG